jgi:hypothetical protein
MANTNFKVDNGFLVTGGDSLFQANTTVNAHVIVRQSLTVNGDVFVVGNLTYSNTSIDGSLIPTANGKALGNTTRTFDIWAGNINISNSIVTANGVAINIRAGSGIIANATGITVNASSISNGVLNIGQGGTNATTQNAALNNLLPTQNTAVNGYYLRTNGTDSSWALNVGPTGFTGSNGVTGFTGSAGPQGVGYTGSQGIIGYTGSAGTNGFNGSVGFTGSQGIIGYTGSQGVIGYTGSAGTNGFNGSVGFTGSQGIIGYTGSQGIIGYTGSAGTNGFNGSVGFTGSQGIIGYTGSAGTNGFNGSAGFTGSQGVGYTGSQGIIGYTGSQGSQGVGYTGSQGIIGYTGSQGIIGYTGSAGVGIVNNGTSAGAVAYYASTGSTLSDGYSATVYAGDFVLSSDKNLKNIFGNITNALNNVTKINGVRYSWNDTARNMGFGSNEEIGLIAQEIEQVYPEFVHTNRENGYKLVNYNKLTAVLIEAIKELNAKVEKLENR